MRKSLSNKSGTEQHILWGRGHVLFVYLDKHFLNRFKICFKLNFLFCVLGFIGNRLFISFCLKNIFVSEIHNRQLKNNYRQKTKIFVTLIRYKIYANSFGSHNLQYYLFWLVNIYWPGVHVLVMHHSCRSFNNKKDFKFNRVFLLCSLLTIIAI